MRKKHIDLTGANSVLVKLDAVNNNLYIFTLRSNILLALGRII